MPSTNVGKLLSGRTKAALLEEIEEEINRTHERKYLFRRPHPLQYEKVGEGKFEATDDLEGTVAITPSISHALSTEQKADDDVSAEERRLKEAKITAKQRRAQFDLFLDLVMVAFIANLAETFSDEAFSTDNPDRDTGGAFLTYVMSFTLIRLIWKDLSRFMNVFFVDDLLQRFFIIIILAIVIVLAGTAPALDIHSESFGETLNAMISCYTLVRAAFGVMLIYYGILLPWLRRVTLTTFVLLIPSLVLWIGTLYVGMPNKIVMFFVALVLEMCMGQVHMMPVYRKMTGGYVLASDVEHHLERISAFLTVLLGSGIELLVSRSPAGHRVAPLLHYVIPSFLIIFFLYFMYANGAGDQVYVHAIRRSPGIEIVWELLHIPLFGSVPILGVALAAITTLSYQDITDPVVIGTLKTAQWVTSACLAEIMLTMTLLALLHKPVQAPYKVLVNNRYLRVLPRFCIVIIIPCLPLVLYPGYQVGTLAGLVAGVSVFEFVAAWRRDGKVFEPKEVARADAEKSQASRQVGIEPKGTGVSAVTGL